MTFTSLRSRFGTTHRARAALAFVAVAGALLGCSSDKSTGPGSVTGTYNVVSVQGPQGVDNTSPFVLLNETIEGTAFRAERLDQPHFQRALHRHGRRQRLHRRRARPRLQRRELSVGRRVHGERQHGDLHARRRE